MRFASYSRGGGPAQAGVVSDAGIHPLPRNEGVLDLVRSPDGQEIGISAGRIVSTTYRRMISLGFISREHADLGTALVVLWGNPGTRQKPIRATIARFPYLTDERNDKIDVEQIPHYAN
jgi:glycine cleavage system aminomethyltransferase T